METGRVDVNNLLMQMRSMKADAQGLQQATPLPGLQPGQQVQPAGAPSFSTMLQGAVNSVNETQMKAADMARSFEMGDPGTSLPEVMIQLQKSSVAFQAMTEVRNKLVSAYQDIMNMPV